MNFVGRVAKGVKDFYNEINPATLTGIYNLKRKIKKIQKFNLKINF